MMTVYIDGAGLLAPGLDGWQQGRAVLAGRERYVHKEFSRPNPAVLSAEMRRRCGDHIRLAVQVASEAVAQAHADPATLASVFASSEADSTITHHICEAVAQEAPMVSPTRFHNSVSNAAAGYWSMAVQSMAASTSVIGFDATFAVGLLEACAQTLTTNTKILLVAHDTTLPEPLHAVRPLGASFAVAFIVTPTRSAQSLAKAHITIKEGAAETVMADQTLEALRKGNPAARSLPMLAAIARTERDAVVLPYLGSSMVMVEIEPCN